ncbi:hypothetical protein L3X38_029238 [Prunus dulcis]|uniref:Uncharacterized protein n=1 Tax=Prunus dulcis TaxID=3755 RepID=A0AAD4Z207_PRUDU|nr:hypothetical protein L3X38_029238 [Prunus dulcis]
MRRQRVGVQSDNIRRKILKTKGQGSYPRLKTLIGATFVLRPTPKNGRKWPDLKFPNRPKPRVLNPISYSENLVNPNQPSARAQKIVEKSYLRRRKWWPEEGEIDRRRIGKNRRICGGRLGGDGREAAELTAGRWLR